MKKDKKEMIIEYINKLQGYKGYVQFSHRPIDKEKDIFVNENPQVKDEDGFIYEAHFCNDKQSIQIRQINDSWLISKTDISHIKDEDIQTYISDIENFDYKIKMAQIWEPQDDEENESEEIKDELCENMKVKKLKKVVFAGFEKGVER